MSRPVTTDPTTSAPGKSYYGARAVLVFLAVTAAGTGLDLWSKAWAFAAVSPGEPMVLIPDALSFRLAMNTGAAFSMFQGQFTFFYVVSALAMGLLTWFAWSAPEGTSWRFPAVLGLLGGGVVGNLYDRVVFAGVRDFVDVYVGHGPTARWLIDRVGTNHWPTFNLADAFICVGAGFLVIVFAREARPQADPEAAAAPASRS